MSARSRLARLALLVAVTLVEVGCTSSKTSASGDSSASVPIESMQIAANSMIFDARAAGPESGPLVLLLHGFPENSYEWRHQLIALGNAGYRAVAPSQRGYSPGARPPNIADYGVVLLAQDVLAMADALGAQRFHLVGHDWGAAVAWVVSVLSPARVISVEPMSVPHPAAFATVLAMNGSTADGGDGAISCQYQASAYFDVFTTPQATDNFVANDYALLRALYNGLPAADVDVYMKEIGNRETIDAGLNWYRANVVNRQVSGGATLGPTTVPTMFLWSDGDTALCRDGADLTSQYVTGPYDFEVITGIDHWIPEKAPDRVNQLLLSHLATYRQ